MWIAGGAFSWYDVLIIISSNYCWTWRFAYVAIRNPERHVRKASHCGSKQQQRSCVAISLTIACSRYVCNGVILHAHPVRGESHNQRNTTGEVATVLGAPNGFCSAYKNFCWRPYTGSLHNVNIHLSYPALRINEEESTPAFTQNHHGWLATSNGFPANDFLYLLSEIVRNVILTKFACYADSDLLFMFQNWNLVSLPSKLKPFITTFKSETLSLPSKLKPCITHTH